MHWGIRNALFKRGFKYYEVAPNGIKKFVNVTGWVGKVGHKKRLTGKDKKYAVMKAVEEHFAYVHRSDNVVDAYILAKIAFEIYMEKNEYRPLPSYQQEVIAKILGP
ncbi:hypothetical protein ACWGJQ_25935 [Peribacillus simplex]